MRSYKREYGKKADIQNKWKETVMQVDFTHTQQKDK